jgi:hypothetical protein
MFVISDLLSRFITIEPEKLIKVCLDPKTLFSLFFLVSDFILSCSCQLNFMTHIARLIFRDPVKFAYLHVTTTAPRKETPGGRSAPRKKRSEEKRLGVFTNISPYPL